MKTDTEDAAYAVALKEIVAGLRADLRGMRKLTTGWMYLRQWDRGPLAFTYGYVRHAAEDGSEWDTLFVFADRESGGRLKRRFSDGFQFGPGRETRPVPEELLAELGERSARI